MRYEEELEAPPELVGEEKTGPTRKEKAKAAARTAGRWIKKGGKWVFVTVPKKTAKYLAEPVEYKEEDENSKGKRKHRTGTTPRGVKIASGIAKAFSPGLPKKEKEILYFGRVRKGFYTGMSPAGRALGAPTVKTTPAAQALQSDYGPLRASTTIPLGHLKSLQRLPDVDKEVYDEIRRNGDHDTPSHVRKEVGALGFTGREINAALSRLRSLGLITHSDKRWDGEKEYMITGG